MQRWTNTLPAACRRASPGPALITAGLLQSTTAASRPSCHFLSLSSASQSHVRGERSPWQQHTGPRRLPGPTSALAAVWLVFLGSGGVLDASWTLPGGSWMFLGGSWRLPGGSAPPADRRRPGGACLSRTAACFFGGAPPSSACVSICFLFSGLPLASYVLLFQNGSDSHHPGSSLTCNFQFSSRENTNGSLIKAGGGGGAPIFLPLSANHNRTHSASLRPPPAVTVAEVQRSSGSLLTSP